MQRQHRPLVVWKLDRETEPALHRELVADEGFDQPAPGREVRFPKPVGRLQAIDDIEPQIVEPIELHVCADVVEESLRRTRGFASEEAGGAVGDEIADPFERGVILGRRDQVSLVEKFAGEAGFLLGKEVHLTVNFQACRSNSP